MRSPDVQQPGIFSYVSVEDRVPSDHPIRKLRVLVDTILGELDGVLAERYARVGRPSIPLEHTSRAWDERAVLRECPGPHRPR